MNSVLGTIGLFVVMVFVIFGGGTALYLITEFISDKWDAARETTAKLRANGYIQ